MDKINLTEAIGEWGLATENLNNKLKEMTRFTEPAQIQIGELAFEVEKWRDVAVSLERLNRWGLNGHYLPLVGRYEFDYDGHTCTIRLVPNLKEKVIKLVEHGNAIPV